MPGRSALRLRPTMPPETLTEPETRLQNVTQNASTVSPTSQRTTLSSEQVASAKLLTLGTEPTSQPSDSCKAIDEGSVQEKHGENVYVQKRRIDSDLEAQYGSDSIHSWGSAESSSNSLDDSSKDLPQPSRDLKIKYIGGHFGEVVPQWEEARAFPNNDTEDRFMKDKTERARGKLVISDVASLLLY